MAYLAFTGQIRPHAPRVIEPLACTECDRPAAVGALSFHGDPLCSACAAIDAERRETCANCSYHGDDCAWRDDVCEFLCPECFNGDGETPEMRRRDFERGEMMYRSPGF